MNRLLKHIAQTDVITISDIINNKWFKMLNNLDLFIVYINRLFSSYKLPTMSLNDFSIHTNMLKFIYEEIENQLNISEILNTKFPQLKNKPIEQWSIQNFSNVFDTLVMSIDATTINKILLRKISSFILMQFNISDTITSINKIYDAFIQQITDLKSCSLPFLTVWNIDHALIKTFIKNLLSDDDYFIKYHNMRGNIQSSNINALLFKNHQYSVNTINLTEMGRKLREKAIFAAKKYCVTHKQDLLFSSLNNDTITYYLDNIDNQLTINNFTQSYPQYEELFEKAGCYNVLDNFVKDIISEYIHKHINTASKYTEFHTLNNAIINALLELLPTFIQNITFPTYENGYYKHTWLDSDTYNRWDANPVYTGL